MELGVSINPIAFLVIQEDNVKILPVSYESSIDRLLDYVPDVIEKINNIADKKMNKKDILKEEIKTNVDIEDY